MQYRTLGQTDLRASSIALGCWGFAGGSMWGDQDEKISIDAIHAALDMGMTFLDTAEGYGDGYSEQIIGKAVAGQRERALIATKVSTQNCTPDGIRAACERSLSYLGSDYIDLYQMHWPAEESVDLEESLGALQRLVEEGKIRHYGVCNFGPKDMDRLGAETEVVSDQVAYSILFRAIEYEIIPMCEKRNTSILTYSSLMHGLLSGKYQTPVEFPVGRGRTRHFAAAHSGARHGLPGHEELTFSTIRKIGQIADDAGMSMVEAAIAWVLKQGVVAAVLAGAKNREQVEANARIGDAVLSDDTYNALCSASEALKEALGPCADMWQPPESSRIH